MKYQVEKSKIFGEVLVPPSKSHTLRALLFALLAKGKSRIQNYLASNDTYRMIEAIEQFGAKVIIDSEFIEIEGVDRKLKRPDDVIQAGNSGQVLRFIAAVGALTDSFVVITGDESIRLRRPVKPLLDALTAQNVFAESLALNGRAPVIIRGPLKPGVFAIEGSDSQPVSALLIATSFLNGGSEIYVMNPGEKPWVKLTLSWLSDLGIKVINHDYRHYKVYGNHSIKGFDVQIPSDFSSACFPAASAMVTRGFVKLKGLKLDDPQPDKQFLEIIKQMGVFVNYEGDDGGIEIDARSDFKGVEVNINDCIDTLPILAVVACFATTPSYIMGAKIARLKESDRISAITKELTKMGAKIDEKEDGLVVYPSKLIGTKVYSHEDHRIAMALLVAGLGSSSQTQVDSVECLAKTYPLFFYDFTSIGAKIKLIN
jgi:3-phosphoshikimate 1-carboxyvinyltransferase